MVIQWAVRGAYTFSTFVVQ